MNIQSVLVQKLWNTFSTLILSVNRTSCTYLCKHNQKEVQSAPYIKAYTKGVLKNNFDYVEISDANLLYLLRAKSLFTRETVHVKYVKDVLLMQIAWYMYVPLWTVFKTLVFRSICLAPNEMLTKAFACNQLLFYEN